MRQSRILRALAGLLIAGLFVFFAFRGISFSSLLHDALRANYLILTIATLVVLFSHFLRALRWRVILQEVKGDISLVDTWGSIMVGYLVNNFIPRLGEIVRAYTTGRLEKISVSSVIGTIVLERLFDMLSAGILFGLALFMYHGDLTASFPFLRIAGIILVAGSIILGGILYIASISEKVQNILLKIVESILPRKIAHKAESIILSFLESFKILRSGKRLGLIAFYTALIWIAYIYSMYIPFFAFGFGARLHLTLYDAFLLILVTTIAWIIPSPGATGVYHLFVSEALVIISGVPKVEALAYATLTQLFSYVAITIVGAIFAIIFTQRLRVKSIGKLVDAGEEVAQRDKEKK
ncbi:MAG: flippase-like domain-containing protein [Bacteroidetes bacterium]|nr:flippase-like domain-containing protein [Bacteroidota bacterium]